MPLTRTQRNTAWALTLLIGAGWATKYVSESELRRLDQEVDRLCAIDGGSVIYETVRLPSVRFHETGKPLVPMGHDDTGFGYFIKGTEQLVAGPYDKVQGASLKRFESQIVRSADGKVIAKSVDYNRSGGDWLRQIFMVGRGKSCVSVEEPWAFMQRVFIKE